MPTRRWVCPSDLKRIDRRSAERIVRANAKTVPVRKELDRLDEPLFGLGLSRDVDILPKIEPSAVLWLDNSNLRAGQVRIVICNDNGSCIRLIHVVRSALL